MAILGPVQIEHDTALIGVVHGEGDLTPSIIGPCLRLRAPPGGSTRTTSAPRSARNAPHLALVVGQLDNPHADQRQRSRFLALQHGRFHLLVAAAACAAS